MRALLRGCVWLALLPGIWGGFCAPVRGQVPAANPGTTTNTELSPLKTSVDIFRELLAMNAGDRERNLAILPASIRAQREQKLREYEAMKPAEREAKLTATELRWYLEQFILTPRMDREAQLGRIPAQYRDIVRQRLGEFDRLPPPLQKEVLGHETTRNYFLGQGLMTNRDLAPAPPLPPASPLNKFSRVPVPQREQMFASFRNYFELEDADKQKVLDTLAVPERRQVEKTLAVLERLSKEQRDQGLQSIDKLAALTDEQRQVFFNNAERWKGMSPAEREAWLKLVSHLPALAPASLMPTPMMLVPPAPRPNNAHLATNSPVP